MGLAESPQCMCDFEEQDLNHLFWACPLLIVERAKMIMVLRQLKLYGPYSVEMLLGNLNKKIVLCVTFLHNFKLN